MEEGPAITLLDRVTKNTHIVIAQGFMEGMELMASRGAKSCSFRPKPIFNALKPIDSVGDRGYIELSWCWQYFCTVSINKRILRQGHWINPTIMPFGPQVKIRCSVHSNPKSVIMC